MLPQQPCTCELPENTFYGRQLLTCVMKQLYFNNTILHHVTMWTPVHGYNTQVSLWLSTMRLVKVGFHFLLLNRYCSRCGAHCRLQLRRLKLVQGQLEFVAQHKQRGWHPRGEELSGPVVQEWSKLFVNVQPCAMCALMPFLCVWLRCSTPPFTWGFYEFLCWPGRMWNLLRGIRVHYLLWLCLGDPSRQSQSPECLQSPWSWLRPLVWLWAT